MKKDITYDSFLPLRDGLVDFASALLGSRDDAEDAVQDLFLKLWKRKDTLSGIENPEAYCRAVLRNMCLDTLKSAGQAKKGEMPEDVAGSDTVEDRVIASEQLSNVRKAIDDLPAGQRTVLLEKVFEDRGYEEISARTGMSGQTMRTQLSLARRTLRNRFAWGFAAAAVAALAVFLFTPRQPEDTFTDPALAYAELERTMEYISSKIEMGEAIARSAGSGFGKAEEIMENINKR